MEKAELEELKRLLRRLEEEDEKNEELKRGSVFDFDAELLRRLSTPDPRVFRRLLGILEA